MSMRTTTLLVLATLLAASVILPTSAAQSTVQRLDVNLQGFVDDPQLTNNRILPETDVAKIRVEALLNVNMYSRSSSCSTPVQVEFTVNGPSYATAVMVPSTRTIVVGGSTSGSQASWEAIPVITALEITVGRNAPAFVDGIYEVTMQARSQSNVQGGSSCDLGVSPATSATYRLKNDYTPRTSVEASELFVNAGPNEKVVFPITLANVGNGPSKVSVTLQPSNDGAFRAVSAGPQVRLAGPIGAGADSATRTVLVEVTTPAKWGYTNEISTLTATVTTTYDGIAPGTTFQESSDITFTVQTQGAYVSPFGLPTIIGAPLLLVLVFVAGMYGGKSAGALRARRRKRKAQRDAEDVDDLEGYESLPVEADEDLVTMRCPKCQHPARVQRGSKPDRCENCGFQ